MDCRAARYCYLLVARYLCHWRNLRAPRSVSVLLKMYDTWPLEGRVTLARELDSGYRFVVELVLVQFLCDVPV